MQNNKVNVNGFTANVMLAKLLTMQRNYEAKKDMLLDNRVDFDAFVTSLVNEAFIFPENQLTSIVAHLSLFLLGNNNNLFSKSVGIC